MPDCFMFLLGCIVGLSLVKLFEEFFGKTIESYLMDPLENMIIKLKH